MFDALPFPVFVVDGDVMVHDYNTAAAEFLFHHMAAPSGLSFHVHNDLPCIEVPAGFRRTIFCRDAIIGKSVKEAFQGSGIVRRFTKLESHQEGFRSKLEIRIACSSFRNGAGKQMLLVFEEMHNTDDMIGVIHICSVCHQIIDEKKALAQLEACAKEYTGVNFSHGLCPKCFRLEMAKIELYAVEKPF
jgi:hypothetical protein